MQSTFRSLFYSFSRRPVSYTKCKLLPMSVEKKMNDRKVIGTHDGKFHCDEVLACAMLRLLPQYADAVVKRTRNPTILETCDIVVDVGGVFDPSIHRYDHHQRVFQESFSSLKPGFPWVTRLSSAGLVYVHFGQEIVSQLLGIPIESELVQETYKRVYEGFIEEIDAIDNGISTHDGPARYKITTNLSSRIGNLNPKWNETETDEDVSTKFNQGMELAKEEFLDKVNYFSKCWWPARKLVVNAIEDRFSVDESGQIIELKNGGCPWKEHFFELEKKMGLDVADKQILYCIFPDTSGSWRIQGVPLSSHSFDLRKALPDQWRGLRDKELDNMCGIDGCVFIHASGFIGGHSTREGALEMGRKALAIAS
ncbi:MYG1 exonuclease-like [Daphnia carinata]|uniref:MYG1 exonuclease-like n=1 Tax=Daphnia carinata TaxID=120202 RepID=UPI00257D7145|nr:MYG1 exonuclease-like [Daphnia carinata]